MPAKKLTHEVLTAAIDGFEAQKARIDAQIAEIRQMLEAGRTEPAATSEVPKVKRRKMSAAARKRIGDAQRKRWAESKRPSGPPSQATVSSEVPQRRPKRKLSAAGRRAIVEATKKRWAAFHAAKEAKKKSGLAKKGAARAARETAA